MVGGRCCAEPTRAVVRFEQVSFSYPARSALVLDGLDLELPPGETVALVGESGAGKSTVAALLLGMLEPTGGRIRVGGVDLGCSRIDAWRRQIAWVPQHPTLLRGTIADNIRLGDPGAPERQVRDAPSAPARTRSSARCRPATRPWSATVRGLSRRASAAGSASPARSSGTPRS